MLAFLLFYQKLIEGVLIIDSNKKEYLSALFRRRLRQALLVHCFQIKNSYFYRSIPG